MADLASADPFFPPMSLSSNPNIFDPLFSEDLYLANGDLLAEIDPDFNFEGFDWDITVDDILLPEDTKPLSQPSDTSNIESQPEPGLLNCPSVSPGTSGSINICSPESSHSANCSVQSCVEVKEEKSGLGTKRKKERDERTGNANISPRSRKFGCSQDYYSYVFKASNQEEEKRNQRLMRNRESAHLSRQRKKQYVEELEERVRSLNSTIAELNSKISFIMAENLSLKQQLGANGNCGFPPGVYPPPPIASMHFPWSSFHTLGFRQQGCSVPLIPIPKLNSHRATSSQKTKKTEKKTSHSKIRKVASITILGALFTVLIFGGLIGRVDHRYEESRYLREGAIKDNLLGNPNGTILSVSNGKNSNGEVDKSFLNVMPGSKYKPWPSDCHMITQNSKEGLPALLYIPRNGKHVEINGNLIINSVLASEKTAAQVKSINPPRHPSGNNGIETGLVIANLNAGVALSNKDTGERSKSYGSSTEHQPALSSDSEEAFVNISQDGSLHQWFREGLTGPIFSSGTCTEVFQFHISSLMANSSGRSNASSPTAERFKNRRFLYSHNAIPLPGSVTSTPNDNDKNTNNNNNNSTMIVSVLVDPRENINGGDGMISSSNKSLQRIFVVVLLDSVKYVTYSCMLPFKNLTPHLVN